MYAIFAKEALLLPLMDGLPVYRSTGSPPCPPPDICQDAQLMERGTVSSESDSSWERGRILTHREAPPEGGTFFVSKVYKREANSRVELYSKGYEKLSFWNL